MGWQSFTKKLRSSVITEGRSWWSEQWDQLAAVASPHRKCLVQALSGSWRYDKKGRIINKKTMGSCNDQKSSENFCERRRASSSASRAQHTIPLPLLSSFHRSPNFGVTLNWHSACDLRSHIHLMSRFAPCIQLPRSHRHFHANESSSAPGSTLTVVGCDKAHNFSKITVILDF